MRAQVECYAGYRGEQTPRRFTLAGRVVEVAEVIDAWLAPDHRYFKVRAGGGDLYILRHDPATLEWEIVSFRRRDPGA
jgi:hypothetical protein